MCRGKVGKSRENNSEPRVAEIALTARVSFFVGFSEVFSLLPLLPSLKSLFFPAFSHHPFLSIAFPCDDAKDCVEERLGDIGRTIANPVSLSLLLVPSFLCLSAFL